MALVVAQEVPTSSSMAVPHGPAGVGEARHRMRVQLRRGGVAESVIDDAVLILSELLSNACKHGRPLGDALAGDGDVRAAWRVDGTGRLTVEVTDGGGPTRPAPATPSVTAHGGRGLNIITALADDWGVRDDARGEVTVWVIVHADVHDPDAGQPARRLRVAGRGPVGVRDIRPGLRGRVQRSRLTRPGPRFRARPSAGHPRAGPCGTSAGHPRGCPQAPVGQVASG